MSNITQVLIRVKLVISCHCHYYYGSILGRSGKFVDQAIQLEFKSSGIDFEQQSVKAQKFHRVHFKDLIVFLEQFPESQPPIQ